MNVEVIVTTMKAKDFSIVDKININSDAIIANQSDFFSYEEKTIRGHSIKMITTNTRGVSLNRNIGISICTGDIIFICDDDAVLPDDYESLIVSEFENHPKASAIKFFCVCTTEGHSLSLKRPKHFKKAGKLSISSAGIHAFAIKRETLLKNDLRFLESIGPGREHNCGEDSVFLRDLIRKKIRVYLSPVQIGTVTRETSSWFTGYNDNYFINCGYIYSKLYGCFAFFAIMRKALIFKKRKKCNLSFFKMVSLMRKGLKEERNIHNA